MNKICVLSMFSGKPVECLGEICSIWDKGSKPEPMCLLNIFLIWNIQRDVSLVSDIQSENDMDDGGSGKAPVKPHLKPSSEVVSGYD